jgi:Zn-dependent peptidase ImmA (M78 family)
MGSVVVWVNSANAPTRQRFTIAHELGHALLHEEGVFRDAAFAPAGNREERDANDFAAALLIPLWMLEPIVTNHRRATAEVASLFDVSPGALGIQLEKLL